MRRIRGFFCDLILLLDDLGVGGVGFDGSDAVEAAVQRLVALTDGDDLTVAGLQTEAELAALVHIDLELRVGQGGDALHGLIFDVGDGSVFCNAGDSLAAGSFWRKAGVLLTLMTLQSFFSVMS